MAVLYPHISREIIIYINKLPIRTLRNWIVFYLALRCVFVFSATRLPLFATRRVVVAVIVIFNAPHNLLHTHPHTHTNTYINKGVSIAEPSR